MSTVVEHYLALSPRDFPHLRSLLLVEQDSGDGPELVVELTFVGSGSESLVVRCAGVRDLVFRQPFTSDMRLNALDVDDVRHAQLETIGFEVRDIEQEHLSFKSRTFDVAKHAAG